MSDGLAYFCSGLAAGTFLVSMLAIGLHLKDSLEPEEDPPEPTPAALDPHGQAFIESAEFERWAAEQGWDIRRSLHGAYDHRTTHALCIGWMARANLETR